MEHLLVFGGKGGVGKSSLSTATAVYLADQFPLKRILLISFDIAHNLSDLFDLPIGNQMTSILPNLFAIEPNPDQYAQKYTSMLTQKTRELLKSMKIITLIPDLENIIEEAIQGQNLSLAMKNAMFFQSLVDAESTQSSPLISDSTTSNLLFDIVICDFPPTANMISLFEVPTDLNQRIMKFTFKILAAMQNSMNTLKRLSQMVKPAAWMISHAIRDERVTEHKLSKEDQQNLAQEILELLKEMEQRNQRIARLLKELGSLRLVTITEKPSFEEAKRARELAAIYIPIDALHINRLIPASERGKSIYLDQLIDSQEHLLSAIQTHFADLRVWTSEMLSEPPIGIVNLRKLANQLYLGTPNDDIVNPLHRNHHSIEQL